MTNSLNEWARKKTDEFLRALLPDLTDENKDSSGPSAIA